MQSSEARLTARERSELEGYLSWSGAVVRAVLFLVATGVVAALCRAIQRGLAVGGYWWSIPTAAFAALLFVRARRWTGGHNLRHLIRLDLAANVVSIHLVEVREAIAVQEGEDEGPTFFVRTAAGETLAFSGQYLTRHAERGFPWSQFEVRETPNARRFLGLTRRGDPVKPSVVKPPLSFASVKALGLLSAQWKVIPHDLDTIRQMT